MSGPGAVDYQTTAQWCDGCNRSTLHLRAVRPSDGWHSDWTCVSMMLQAGHRVGVDNPCLCGSTSDSGYLCAEPASHWGCLCIGDHGPNCEYRASWPGLDEPEPPF